MRKRSNRKCVDAFRQYLSPIALLPSSNLFPHSAMVIIRIYVYMYYFFRTYVRSPGAVGEPGEKIKL